MFIIEIYHQSCIFSFISWFTLARVRLVSQLYCQNLLFPRHDGAVSSFRRLLCLMRGLHFCICVRRSKQWLAGLIFSLRCVMLDPYRGWRHLNRMRQHHRCCVRHLEQYGSCFDLFLLNCHVRSTSVRALSLSLEAILILDGCLTRQSAKLFRF